MRKSNESYNITVKINDSFRTNRTVFEELFSKTQLLYKMTFGIDRTFLETT